jgi:uncharacterized membrane protein
MYASETVTLTWYALALAAIYLGINAALTKREPNQYTSVIGLLHVAIAIAFLTIAIPLKLNAQWITIGWLVEAAVLLWISATRKVGILRYFGVVALVLGVFRLLFFDRFDVHTLVFNPRFATYLVAIAVFAGISTFGRRYASERESPFISIAVVMMNLMALIAMTLEASDYFNRQVQTVFHQDTYAIYQQQAIARDFSFSAIWLLYGAMLMTVGFVKRSAFARWQALILIAVTIVKVFTYDLSNLGGSYRILSFIALGVILLAISFIYQRDWLKLSSRSSEKAGQEAQ